MATNKKIQNLIRAFVKNISADKTQPKNTNIVYGTVVSRGGTKQVLLDGGTEPTACMFNVEADEGDRVVCSVQNHSWSVDSNVTKPASSPTTVKGRSDVESIIDEHVISLSGIDVYYQREQPTEPSAGFKDGDTWYELDANGYASKLHVWKNGEWVDTQFDGGNIIRANSITANEIATNTITANKINLTDVFSQNITASGTITGVTIKAKSADNNIQLDINGLTFSNGDGNIYGRIYGNTIGLDANKGLYIGATNYTHIIGSTVIMPGRKLYVGDPDGGTSYMEITRTSITADGAFYSNRSDIGFSHTHGTSDTKISFGVGSGGTNRGIYDDTEKGWMIYRGPYGKQTVISGGIRTSGSVIPHTNGDCNLGGSANRWNVVCTNALWLFRATSYHFAFSGTPTANRTITFQNASGTVAFTSSDARLKENIKDTDLSGLDMVNKMQIRQFDWLDDETAGYNKGRHQTIGFVADELEELDPFFIVNGSGGEDDDGNINPKCVDTFYMLGYMAKAIQELSAKVDELSK